MDDQAWADKVATIRLTFFLVLAKKNCVAHSLISGWRVPLSVYF